MALENLRSIFSEPDTRPEPKSTMDKLLDSTSLDDIGVISFPTDEFYKTPIRLGGALALQNSIQGFTKNFSTSRMTTEVTNEVHTYMTDRFSVDMQPYNHRRPTELQLPTRDITFAQPSDSMMAGTLLETNGWELLYNSDHTVKPYNPGYNHGLNVDRSKLRLANPTHRRGTEPYIVTNIGDKTASTRNIPIGRALTDVSRLTKLLTSHTGLEFTLKQNALGQISRIVYRDGDAMKVGSQLSNRFKGAYLPTSTFTAVGGRLLGTSPNVLVDRHFPRDNEIIDEITGQAFGVASTYGRWIKQNVHDLNSSFNAPSPGNIVDKLGDKLLSAAKGYAQRSLGLPEDLKNSSNGGDLFTNSIITSSPSNDLKDAYVGASELEARKNGMPLYFKDLRDNSYIFFRAYISSLTENVNPSWNSETYIGRSEPVYTYQSAERDLSFNLKAFAHTREELSNIYKKLTKLTSMCYPEYKQDSHMITATSNNNETDILGNSSETNVPLGKVRMKPPITKFRLGELYGKSNREMVGFLKSLTYTFPDEGVWETEEGSRVPKYIDISINFQVIHTEVPSLTTQDFYGYDGQTIADTKNYVDDILDAIPNYNVSQFFT